MYLRPLLALTLVASPVFAQSEDQQSCTSISTYRDVLLCAIERHPDSVQARLLFEQSNNLVGVAEQRPNPELNSQFLGGNNGDDKYRYAQINLAHTFEVGGKRGARIDRAKAETKNSELNFKLAKEEVYVRTYLAMIRLRQIADELEVFDDALSTFARIQKQYKSRPRMTPEQRATYAIMDVASNDYRLRRQPLVNEARATERFLELAIGRKLDVRKDFFPSMRKQWPSVSGGKTREVTSLQVQRAMTELESAKAELSEAQANAWPDIKFGPTFEQQQQGQQNFSALGVNLTLNIPIFHLNGSGKAFAQVGVTRAETALSNARRVENQQWELQRDIYQDAVNAIQKSISSSDLHGRHREVETSFSNGVLPSSLVIEIHRQMADYMKSLNEQENLAIEALAKIYSIENRLLSEGL